MEFAGSLDGPWRSVYGRRPTLAAGEREGSQDAVPQGTAVGSGRVRLNVVEVPATPPEDVDMLLELFAGP